MCARVLYVRVCTCHYKGRFQRRIGSINILILRRPCMPVSEFTSLFLCVCVCARARADVCVYVYLLRACVRAVYICVYIRV